MQKCLIPLDGSALAEAILPWAKLLAEKRGYKIELMRCYSSLASLYTFSDFATPPPISLDLDGFKRQTEQYLAGLAQKHELDDPVLTVLEGDPASLILKRSADAEVAEVYLSSHGVGGFGRWFMGSVATKIVRASRKPIFLLKHSEETPECRPFKKILVALDGSEASEPTAMAASSIARAFQATMHLYTAVFVTPHPYYDPQNALQKGLDSSREELEKLSQKFPDLTVTSSTSIALPTDGILEKSEEHDLLVVASHGYGGFERWLLGSVTEKLLNKTKIPMFIVYYEEGTKE